MPQLHTKQPSGVAPGLSAGARISCSVQCSVFWIAERRSRYGSGTFCPVAGCIPGASVW